MIKNICIRVDDGGRRSTVNHQNGGGRQQPTRHSTSSNRKHLYKNHNTYDLRPTYSSITGISPGIYFVSHGFRSPVQATLFLELDKCESQPDRKTRRRLQCPAAMCHQTRHLPLFTLLKMEGHILQR